MNHRVSIHTPGRLTVLAALLAGFAVPALAATDSPIVISQVFGGGGNSGAKIKNDYIELFNRSSSPVSVEGWSVQYASAGGTGAWQVTRLTGTIQPGQYYLVQEAAGTGGDTALPAPEASGTLAMAGGAGKVALSKTATALSGALPTSASLMDLVGYGTGTSGANGFEGTGPTPTLSPTLAAVRKEGGCTDDNDNAADFVTATPAPRNSAAPIHMCSGAGPAAEPIVAACPASIWSQQGSPIEGLLKASDADSIVNAAAITSGARAGITLGPVTVPPKGGTAEVALQVADSVPAGTYTVGVTFTNDASQTASCNVAVKVAGSHTIPQIQGSGATTPYNNSVQTVEGVLTAKVGSGFFIQDATGDNNPDTSDGIFVFGPRIEAQPGQLIRVTGTVTEYTPTGASRSYTEFKDVLAVTNLGGSYTIAPTNIELPNADLGRYEGMLVHVNTPLTVNGNSYLGNRGELVLSYGLREQPTNRYAPRTAEANALALENARNVIVLDDGIFVTPDTVPYLGENGTVRTGDTVTNLTGVLDYGAAGGIDPAFKLQPTETPSISRTNPRTDAPLVAPGNVRVASANVLNFFTTFTNGETAFGETGKGCTIGTTSVSKSNCRGADNLQEFERQRDKIVGELKAIDADAVGLMEIQNNGDVAVGYLVDALNAAYGSKVYAVVPYSGQQSTDAIRTAMIYKPAKLSLVGPALSDANSINNRAPLAQTFKAANGAKFSLIVNHLRAKGSCSTSGGAANQDTDGQGCWNGQRLQQVQRLFDYLIPQVKAASGDDDILLVGDMNSYAKEDPINLFTSKGLVNEVERFVRPNGIPHSYVFDALSGYLDHALTTPSLSAQVAGVTEWHNNADEPEALDYNLGDTTQDLYAKDAFRASDHDPVVVSLNLAPTFVDASGSVKIAQSGYSLNRFTSKYTGTVTFTNTSGAAINGPLQFVLQGLPAGITLDNKSGDQNGAPYVTLPNASIAAGASVSVNVTFSNPNKTTIAYTPKLYTGTF